MKYVIDKNNEKLKLMTYSINMTGLDVKPNNESSSKIKAKNIKIIDSKLRESYIKKKVNIKIDKVIEFMVNLLNDDDATDEDVGMVLDEVNKLKGIVVNKYKEHMKKSDYKALLTKLIIIEEEFKKNYNQKLFTNYIQNSIYEEVIEGRGR